MNYVDQLTSVLYSKRTYIRIYVYLYTSNLIIMNAIIYITIYVTFFEKDEVESYIRPMTYYQLKVRSKLGIFNK